MSGLRGSPALLPGEQSASVESLRPEVRCGNCNRKVFDGVVIKARLVRVLPRGAEAKCPQCKGWVGVPVTYAN